MIINCRDPRNFEYPLDWGRILKRYFDSAPSKFLEPSKVYYKWLEDTHGIKVKFSSHVILTIELDDELYLMMLLKWANQYDN